MRGEQPIAAFAVAQGIGHANLPDNGLSVAPVVLRESQPTPEMTIMTRIIPVHVVHRVDSGSLGPLSLPGGSIRRVL